MKELFFLSLLSNCAAIDAAAQPGTVVGHTKISAAQTSLTDKPFWKLGFSVCLLSDMDGDGIRELAAGNFYNSDGKIYIFRLNANGTPKANYTVIGEDTGGFVGFVPTTFQTFGSSLANMGDLDGNGIDDLAVGNPQGNKFYILFLNNAGKVDSFRQYSPGLNGFPTTSPANASLGKGITNIGDLDHDGFIDLAVSDYEAGTYRGSLWIVYLKAGGRIKSAVEIKSNTGGFNYTLAVNDGWGLGLSAIGDLDKDGNTDLMIGGIKFAGGQRGEVFTLFMNSNGTVKSFKQYVPGTAVFPDTMMTASNFGSAIAPIGDIDGDSVMDVAIGAARFKDSLGVITGRVYVWMMNTDGSIKAIQRIDKYYGNLSVPMDNNYNFGTSLATVGDWNGDGKFDLLAGASGDDDAVPTNINRNSGALYFLYLDGVDHTPVQTAVGDLIVNEGKDYYAYPNPASDQLIIRPRSTSQVIQSVTVLDMTGKILFKVPVQNSKATVEVARLPVGNYIIRVTDKEQTQTIRFTKN